MIGAIEAERMLNRETLEQNRQPALIDIAKGYPFQMKLENEKTRAYMKFLEALKLKEFEMSYDFNHRTAIHDCMDFKQLATPSRYQSILIRLAIESHSESNVYREILTGIFGLSIE